MSFPVEVWGQPDAFTAYDPPSGGDVALVDGPVTQDELFSETAGSSVAAGSPESSTGGNRGGSVPRLAKNQS